MANTKLILYLGLIWSVGLAGCSSVEKARRPVYPLTLTEIKQIDEALPKLKFGMSHEQIWKILSHTALSGEVLTTGSGPMSDYRVIYHLRPGCNLVLVEDATSKPPQFVRYEKAGTQWY